MTPEWLTAISALATLVVVGVTAFAALRQIRHMRSGNQVAALLPLQEKYASPDIQASLNYVLSDLRTDVEDPAVRADLERIPASGSADRAKACINFYEAVGALVCAGVLDIGLVLRYFNTPLNIWTISSDYIAVTRRTRGPEVFENFEAMVVLQQRYELRHGTSLYPRGMPRLGAADRWPEESAAHDA